ncbi:MAG: DUF748 domain-containing protein [Planctomycetes bacterium]|nr:DUF748 domain-containing protein [Planctomycetota bacterium]
MNDANASTAPSTPATPAAQPDPAARKRQRIRSIILWISSFVGIVSLVGFFILPLLIRHVGIPQINKRINGVASLKGVYINPWAMGVVLEEFSVVDSAGKPVAAFERFDGRFEMWASIFKGGWRFKRAVLNRLDARAEIFKDGVLNVAALRKPSTEPAKPSEPIKKLPRVIVEDLRLLNSDITFSDNTLPAPFALALKDVRFIFDPLDSSPEHPNTYRLTTVTDAGERISWKGDLHVNPFSTSGEVTIDSLALPRFMPYAMRYTNARVVSGVLNAVLECDFAPAADQPLANVRIKTASIDNLKVEQPDGELLDVGKVNLTDALANAESKSLEVALLEIDSPSAFIRRDTKSILNLQTLLTPTPKAASTAARQRIDHKTVQYPIERLIVAISNLIEDASGDWSITANKIRIRDAAAAWDDAATFSPVALRASSAAIEAGPISSADRFRTPFTLSAKLGDHGAVALSGTLAPLDRTADLTVKLDNLDTAPFAPYIPEKPEPSLPRIRLAGAMLSLEGKAAANLPDKGPAAASWSGQLKIASAAVNNADGGPAVLTSDSLQATGDASLSGADSNFQQANWKGTVNIAKFASNLPAPQSLAAAFDTLILDGQAHAELSSGAAAWSGKTLFTNLSAQIQAEKAAIARADQLSIEGDASRAGDTGKLAWKGTLRAAQVGAASAGESETTIGTLAIQGEADALTSPNPDINWSGKVEAATIAAAITNVAHTTLVALSLDGKARVSGPKDSATAQWNGAINAQALAAKVDAEPKADATIATLAVTGEAQLGLTAAGPGRAQWKGDLQSGPLTLDAMPDNPVSIKLARAGVKGELACESLTAQPPDLTFTGDVDTGQIVLAAPQRAALEATLNSVVLKTIALSTGGKTISLADAAIESPNLKASTAILPPPTDPKAPKPPRTRPPLGADLRALLPYQFKITHAKITNGIYELTDTAAQPPLELRGEDLQIEATNLGSDGQSTADFTISTKVQQTGQLRFLGKIDPFRDSPSADVQLQVASLPLKPYDAITGRYIGYLVDQGRMDVKLPIKIDAGKVKGNLDFRFDKFYLGKEVKSPDAPDVPIELGLALLRDTDEQIKGDIPLSGDMNDPQFTVVGLVWQAFFNLIVKAATAPFQILGSLIGAGEGEDLSVILFDPGLDTLPPDSIARLDKLGKGMTDRPGLKIKVIGRASSKTDTPALAKSMLREQIAAGGAPITPDQYAAAVEQMYYLKINQPMPRRKATEPPPVPMEQMEKTVIEGIVVPPERLQQLAERRAVAVVNTFVRDHVIAPDRVQAVPDKGGKIEADDSRVDLELH